MTKWFQLLFLLSKHCCVYQLISKFLLTNLVNTFPTWINSTKIINFIDRRLIYWFIYFTKLGCGTWYEWKEGEYYENKEDNYWYLTWLQCSEKHSLEDRSVPQGGNFRGKYCLNGNFLLRMKHGNNESKVEVKKNNGSLLQWMKCSCEHLTHTNTHMHIHTYFSKRYFEWILISK